MDLKPKYSRSSLKNWNGVTEKTGGRHFVGRELPMQDLIDAIEVKLSLKYEVIHYYGIGGIGKTRLQKEMKEMLVKQDPDMMIGHLNFEAPHLHQVGGALVELREQLKASYKVNFDWFDLACTVLWKKVNPRLSFDKNRRDLPFIDEGTYLAELISLVDGLPFVQWVPKTMQLAQTVSNRFKEWKRSSLDLSKMIDNLASLHAFEIEERLPLFFAEDMRTFLKKNPGTPVIFIDTYEALSDKGRLQGAVNEQEEWVKELILQLPEVLWVVFGRERLDWVRDHSDWEKIVKQTLIDPLSVEDREKFLRKAGIDDEEIRSKMIDVSKGLPYQLDLLVDTYELIKKKKLPAVADFSDSTNLIVERLMKYLTLPERELLKVLSFPRQWNEALFKKMIKKLSIGYPATAIEELCRFSFIDKIADDQWEMHPIMQNSFQRVIKQEQPSFYAQIHRLLFNESKNLVDSYNGLLDSKAEYNLNDMAFHAAKFKPTAIEEEIIVKVVNSFFQAGRFKPFTPPSEDLQEMLETLTRPFSLAQIYAVVGQVASIQGRLEYALDQFELAEQNMKKDDSKAERYFDVSLRIKREAANIHMKRTSYEKARQLLQSASELESQMTHADIQLVHVYLQLGKLENDSRNKVKAGECYAKAFELIERLIEKDGGTAELLSVQGTIYEKQGEWLTSAHLAEQRQVYESAIECYEQAVGKTGSLNLEIEANRGLAWKRLAENYSKQAALKNETIDAFQTAIAIYDGILGVHGDYVEVLVKKGHAAVDFLRFLGQCDMFEQAEQAFEMAILAFEQAIELSTDQASAHNRIASAHRELAVLYRRMGKEELAQATFTRAIEESNLLIRRYPNYINAQSTLNKIYSAMEV